MFSAMHVKVRGKFKEAHSFLPPCGPGNQTQSQTQQLASYSAELSHKPHFYICKNHSLETLQSSLAFKQEFGNTARPGSTIREIEAKGLQVKVSIGPWSYVQDQLGQLSE